MKKKKITCLYQSLRKDNALCCIYAYRWVHGIISQFLPSGHRQLVRGCRLHWEGSSAWRWEWGVRAFMASVAHRSSASLAFRVQVPPFCTSFRHLQLLALRICSFIWIPGEVAMHCLGFYFWKQLQDLSCHSQSSHFESTTHIKNRYIYDPKLIWLL